MDIIVQIISVLVQHETNLFEINMRLVLYWLTATIVFTCYALKVLWDDYKLGDITELRERNNAKERELNKILDEIEMGKGSCE